MLARVLRNIFAGDHYPNLPALPDEIAAIAREGLRKQEWEEWSMRLADMFQLIRAGVRGAHRLNDSNAGSVKMDKRERACGFVSSGW